MVTSVADQWLRARHLPVVRRTVLSMVLSAGLLSAAPQEARA
jgi:hypothetical protein